MKTRILLLLVITFTACASIAAQTEGVLREVTLYYFQYPEQPDRSRSSVNFETGERGPDRSGSFDLRYGGMAIGTPGTPGKPGKFLADWLGVLDCRSMVVDLGAKQWQDFKTTPPFPKPKHRSRRVLWPSLFARLTLRRAAQIFRLTASTSWSIRGIFTSPGSCVEAK